jgi:hypothetical protein
MGGKTENYSFLLCSVNILYIHETGMLPLKSAMLVYLILLVILFYKAAFKKLWFPFSWVLGFLGQCYQQYLVGHGAYISCCLMTGHGSFLDIHLSLDKSIMVHLWEFHG